MLNWNDSTVPGWQTMWQLTPVGIQSADRSVHEMSNGMWEMARLAHSRSEGMLNRKAQKDAQKRQQKQQDKMFKKQVGTSLGIGLGTAALTAGVGAAIAPTVAPAAEAGLGSAAAKSSLEPVMEGAAMSGAEASAPIAESTAGGLSPIVGTADDMGLPVLVPSETGATYSLGDFAGQGGSMGNVGGVPQLTPTTPDPHISAVGDNLANTRSQLRGQMGSGVGGDTTGLGAPQGGSSWWDRFGKNFGLQMMGQLPYWATAGSR